MAVADRNLHDVLAIQNYQIAGLQVATVINIVNLYSVSLPYTFNALCHVAAVSVRV